MDILSQYVLKYPTAQNVLDIFDGEWSSALPPHTQLKTKPGTARLFEDARIVWGVELLGGVKEAKILELGPLEGGHSYMLQQMGAQSVLAIEANTRSYLKCLCIKEVLNLHKVTYQLGDFVAFLEKNPEKFDMVIASGVLYHMEEPLKLLKLIADNAEKMLLWSHYYDAEVIHANPNLSHKFKNPEQIEFLGETYELCQQSYKDALEWSGFCGGSAPTSRWISKESLFRCLNNLGFKHIETNFEQADHPNGPALALCASKTPLR